MLQLDADVGRAASAGVLAAAPPALRTAVGTTPDMFSTAVAGSGPNAEVELARSPLIPTAAYYNQAFGWPIAMDADDIVLVCGEAVDVLAMPAGLGGEVNHLLMINRLYAPVVELRDDNERMTWAFLCEPRECRQPPGSLVHHGVKHFGTGAIVRLPLSPGCGSGVPRWVSQPKGGESGGLPPWMSVFSCAHKAVRR